MIENNRKFELTIIKLKENKTRCNLYKDCSSTGCDHYNEHPYRCDCEEAKCEFGEVTRCIGYSMPL
jgi:hypothetical protein